MIWATWISQALSWLRDNWIPAGIGAVLGWVLCLLLGGGGGSAPVTAVASAGASQSLSGTAAASNTAVIKVGGRASMPCPPDKVCPECPSLEVAYDSRATISGGATSSVSATASVAIKPQNWGVTAGGAIGLLAPSDLTQASALLGLNYKAFMLYVDGGITKQAAGLAYTHRF